MAELARADRGGACVSLSTAAGFLTPRTSASDRSSSADRSLLGSTVLGPPLACTPVYVDCRHARCQPVSGQHPSLASISSQWAPAKIAGSQDRLE